MNYLTMTEFCDRLDKRKLSIHRSTLDTLFRRGKISGAQHHPDETGWVIPFESVEEVIEAVETYLQTRDTSRQTRGLQLAASNAVTRANAVELLREILAVLQRLDAKW